MGKKMQEPKTILVPECLRQNKLKVYRVTFKPLSDHAPVMDIVPWFYDNLRKSLSELSEFVDVMEKGSNIWALVIQLFGKKWTNWRCEGFI